MRHVFCVFLALKTGIRSVPLVSFSVLDGREQRARVCSGAARGSRLALLLKIDFRREEEQQQQQSEKVEEGESAMC